MRVVPQSVLREGMVMSDQWFVEYVAHIARTCYQSKSRSLEADIRLVEMILDNKHLSVIEHVSATFRIVCSRKISHQLVRHRIASYTQESTRYNKYVECIFVKPHWMEFQEAVTYHDKEALKNQRPEVQHWMNSMMKYEKDYNTALTIGMKPEDASDFLPHATKTELVMTANLREWMHILEMRRAKEAHPDMRNLMELIDAQLREMYPIIFAPEEVGKCL